MMLQRFLPQSLRAQLLIGGILSISIVMTAVGWVDFRIAETDARREVQERMVQTATAFQSALERATPAQAQAILEDFDRSSPPAEGRQVLILDRQGVVVASLNYGDIGKSLEGATDHSEQLALEVLAGHLPQAQEVMTHGGISVFDFTLPLYGDPANPTRVTGVLHYMEPYTAYTSRLQNAILRYSLSMLLLTLLLITPLWFFVNRRILRPVQRIVEADRALVAGHREGRTIPASDMPQNEIGEIARSREQMLDRLDSAEGEVRRRLRELAALNATATLLSQSLQLQDVLGRILEKVSEITGAEAAEINLLEPATGRLMVQAEHGFLHSPAPETERPMRCLCSAVVQREEPLFVEDSPNRATPHPQIACRRNGSRNSCIVPLRAEGEVLGVMSLHSHLPLPQSTHDQDLISAIGSQISATLINIRLYQETQRLSVTDPLTGLHNRRALEQHLQIESRRALRYQHSLSVIMADIDHFKQYNDAHGHPQGDLVLKQVADLMRNQVRETDFVARYGGEEFTILLPETPMDAGLAVAEKIRAAVEAERFPNGETQPGGRLTISLGMATSPDGLGDAQELIKKADAALYRAKRAGRDRVMGDS